MSEAITAPGRTAARLVRERAMELVLGLLPADTALIGANGHLSRALHALEDRPGAFYMIGSMGLAPAIGLGIALAQPHRRVAIFDGDGNVLMAMGTLATVAAKRPPRLLHLCFDNESYGSTGGQRTLSATVDLARVAAAAGYAWTARVEEEAALQQAVRQALAVSGPSFLLIKIRPGGLPPGTPRVALAPEAMTARMRRFLGAGALASSACPTAAP